MNITTKAYKVLNPAYRKITITRQEIDSFKTLLNECLEHIRINEERRESEENIKNYLGSFLQKAFYSEHLINTKDKIDLAIFLGKDAKSDIGVILEAKRPSNISEFLSPDNINKKALQELLLYYLKERVSGGNNKIKHLIATNGYEWYFFKAEDFYTYFYKNNKLLKEYNEFIAGKKDSIKNELFYSEIAKKYIEEVQHELPFLYINIKEYENLLPLENTDDDKLVALYKVFSPVNLLGHSFGNDSNQLNKQFYFELLHIIGLEEIKDGGKKVIQRKPKGSRNHGSLLESTIFTLDDRDYLRKVENLRSFGTNREEQLFNVALELCLTWINRILFLKLLESQLISYHNGSTKYKFLHREFVKGFDELEELFFSALAKKPEDRNERIKNKYQLIPYLNSSLFEPNELEDKALQISNLKDADLELHEKTILKDNLKRQTGSLNTLEYLFNFLEAYDFSGDNGEKVNESNQQKSLISASVLGLIFEKINGYKDGSFYTPAYITMYMSREALRRAVVQKFNNQYKWNCKDFDELQEDLKDHIRKGDRDIIRKEANQIINSLKICDPAVGSGHFLVSCLNELIAIKSELNILIDKEGKRLNAYILLENDELIIEDENERIFLYQPDNKTSQRIQETLFHEKQSLIENCLFGVDINPNSVKICRLRLWIELLKNAYYTESGQLQTLPNIDINIKTGNSLISRFELDDNLKSAFKSKDNPYSLQDYKNAVNEYKNTNDKSRKRDILTIISTIKSAFKDKLDTDFIKKLATARGKFEQMQTQLQNLEAFGEKPSKKEKEELKKLQLDFDKAQGEKEEILDNVIYQNAFEWRFEFPEVLDENGDFLGFDVVIGNPPYFSVRADETFKNEYFTKFHTFSASTDIYALFFETAFNILKTCGLNIFIVSNKWVNASYGENLRSFLAKEASPLLLVDFDKLQIFSDAVVFVNITLFEKSPNINLLKGCIIDSENHLLNLENSIYTRLVKMPDIDELIWRIISDKEQNINKKIRVGKLLQDWNISFYRGVTTGLNEAFVIPKEQLDLLEIDNIDLAKPVLRGRDIKRYKLDFNDLYLIGTFSSKGIDIEKYPQIKSYLEVNFGIERLKQDGAKESRKKTMGEWYEIQDTTSYWQEFEKPKIIWLEISDRANFTYDDQNHYLLNSAYLITGENLKYLLGILNSKLLDFYFFQISPQIAGGRRRYTKQYVEQLPIIEPTSAQSTPIIDLVEKILSAKKEDPTASTEAWEQEIDVLVYKLYGLSYEEVLVVDPGAAEWLGEGDYNHNLGSSSDSSKSDAKVRISGLLGMVEIKQLEQLCNDLEKVGLFVEKYDKTGIAMNSLSDFANMFTWAVSNIPANIQGSFQWDVIKLGVKTLWDSIKGKKYTTLNSGSKSEEKDATLGLEIQVGDKSLRFNVSNLPDDQFSEALDKVLPICKEVMDNNLKDEIWKIVCEYDSRNQKWIPIDKLKVALEKQKMK